MTLLYSKTYEIPITRKIATGFIKPTETSYADIYVEKDLSKQEFISNSVDSLKTVIYNIDKRNNKQLIIYTNTLNIKITNIFIKNIPLYNKLVFNTEDINLVESEIKKITTEYYIVDNVLYLNTNLKFLSLGSVNYRIYNVVEIGTSIKLGENIKIRKLRDRLKITYTVDDNSNFVVAKKHDLSFQPEVHENWLEFPEFVIKDATNKYIHVYHHSFNTISKKEFQPKITSSLLNLKDPIWDDNIIIDKTTSNKYDIYTYNTYRSNLLVASNYATNLYFYLDFNYINKTDLIKISPVKLNDDGLIFIFSTSVKENIVKNIYPNPEKYSNLYDLKGEDYTFIFSNDETKYKRAEDIRFSNNRVLLNLTDVIRKKSNYIRVNNTNIIQEYNLSSIPINSYNIKTDLSDLPADLLARLVTFNTTLTNSLNVVTTFPDNIKQYTEE